MYAPLRGYRKPIDYVPGEHTPAKWPCPRCGQEVSTKLNVAYPAPCRDCREYAREEEGDKTIWDKRTLARHAEQQAAS